MIRRSASRARMLLHSLHTFGAWALVVGACDFRTFPHIWQTWVYFTAHQRSIQPRKPSPRVIDLAG